MGDLANCPRCHAIFMKGAAVVCPACSKKEEEDFQTVYAFMRKKQNRTATVEEIEENTGVPEKRIRQFVKQKRLHPAQFPNLAYGCEKCGASVREGRICERCQRDIQTGLRQHEQNESFRNKKIEAEQAKESRTYYSVNNDS